MAIKIKVLGSGSGGNCTLVDTGRTRVLIDAARLGQRYITARLSETGVDIKEIDAIFATHMHGDHVDSGVTYPICRKHDIPLFVHEGSFADLVRRSSRFLELERAGLVRKFRTERFVFNGLTISPFEVSHGSGGWNADIVGRPVGFRMSLFDGPRETVFSYSTDLGQVTPEIEQAMAGAD
ncbi:MAG TPA: MBL fold metallo-hydrolase, partial [bacterium]|nr:MBL fold metallo-hydrolase [bacterium]